MIKSSEPSIELDAAITPTEADNKRKSIFLTVGLMLLITGLIFAAYANVIFHFFIGDDFGLVVYLREAIKSPALLIRDFTGSWLGSPTAQFYRPLISVTVLSDYFLFGRDTTGYHVTNVLYLVAPALCLYFIVRSLAGPKLLAKLPLWPALAAILFGLYPLHSETVAWITGRVDSVVTAFYVGSVLAYMRWRDTNNRWYFATSIICIMLSLFSKEMGIMIPATIAAYEFIVEHGETSRTWLRRFRDAALLSAPFWLVLAGYFLLRRYALGTFVGGYDDAPFNFSDLQTLKYNWEHGLRALFIPANQDLMGSKDILVILWQVCLIPAVVLSVLSLKEPMLRSRLFFCLVWAALSLAPVYKLFNISPDLQSSRYGYLTSVSLACLLTVGLAWFIQFCINKTKNNGTTMNWQRLLPRAGLLVSSTIAILMLCVAFGMLRVNNSAWAEAGITSNAIQAELRKFYENNAGDPPVLLLNMPDHLHGAYICRNALEGLTQSPQVPRDVHNLVSIGEFDRLTPFGYMKDSFSKNREQVRILAWNQSKKVLLPVVLTADDETASSSFLLTEAQLNSAISPYRETCTVTPGTESGVTIKPKKLSKRAEVLIDLPTPLKCFPTDFLAVDLQPESMPTESKVDLEFNNNIFEQFTSSDLIRGFLKTPATNEKQTVVFALRSHPTWIMGGEATKLMLRLPLNTGYRLSSIRSIPASEIMPLVSFPGSDCLGSKGVAYLEPAKPTVLTYDASKIGGAVGGDLEITKRNGAFQWPNSAAADEPATVLKKQTGASGKIPLARADFKDKGLFELRCRAVDASGNKLGVASDHFVVFMTE
ncbi:MAG: hypothetical protein SGJ27_31010 [Candidatus Melainabacteria bacterium]|nr:hypothetical protein [Candidatus Melainabacteria bacterium]